ncbi:PREDICTED: protein FAR1-RELATED SEQUENCE 7 [Theobroma cacao]|uniref:Protein FAR1-RELATED SEQUENCE n=1 Tax=Theobroma cacao TaxID=3641 RepID=A0AB32V620_THECC|nr:PREDICTED: protein FAR1-RELATED SEQUENCE 7 [Theobroma cacao]XP_007031718.2 PREDICTED: protein FAR1-RELATED SEQUENCE 7 [Theobroma cacao]
MDSSDPDILTQGQNLDIENELQESNQVDVDVCQECQSLEACSVEKSQEVTESESDSQSPNASSVDKSEVEINADECQTAQVPIVNKCEIDVDGEQNSQSPNALSVDVLEARVSVKDEDDIFVVPAVGMEFESEEHAHKCYSRYAVLEGFSIRKDFVNKSRVNGAIVSRRYTCYRQGYRPGKHTVNVRKPQQEMRTGCLAHMTIARQPNGKFRVSHFETKHNHEFVNPSTAHLLPSQKRLTFAQAVEADLASSSGMDGVPKLGMGFKSEDHAYEFYNTYAGRVGFSVRKDYVNRSKIDGAVASRRFTCFREGFRQKDKRDLNVKRPRKETRIGCLAQLVISRQPDGKYRVTHFEEKHNHELVAACRVRMLRSQKRLAVARIVEGNALESYKIQAKSAYEVPCNSIGDCVDHGYDPIDHRSKLSSKRTRDMREGEAERIQQYFQSRKIKNPSFFYAIQLDAENQIANIFWADAKMIMDYSDFGDVLCFDTTYMLNKDCRLFSPFLGVNHHKQMVIFGAALLYDDTVDSFKWLFQKFLEAMSGKNPKTILTDEDAVVSEAVNSIFPEIHQRMCVWHVYQSALKQLGDKFVGPSFVNDLSSCFFNHEEEEDFIAAWNIMLDVHGLWENDWLNKIFETREQWAIAYKRHIFCADINSVQLHESFIVNLKKYLKPESDVLSFFKHLGKVVNDWHYKELEANYDMSQNMPRLMGDVILLKHARDAYTPRIFELFQQEYEMCLNIVINQCIESETAFEYKGSIYGQPREYAISYNLADNTVFCSCMKYEFMGVLCSHALKVLDYRNIRLLPSQYILKRWTRDARV